MHEKVDSHATPPCLRVLRVKGSFDLRPARALHHGAPPDPSRASMNLDRRTFLELSAELTGYSATDLEGTGLVDTWQGLLEQQAEGSTIDQLYAAARRVLEHPSGPARAHAMKMEIVASPTYWPMCTAVIQAWYMGAWTNFGAAWYTFIGEKPPKGVVPGATHVPSAQAYEQQLSYRGAGAHPPGARPTGHGGWSHSAGVRRRGATLHGGCDMTAHYDAVIVGAASPGRSWPARSPTRDTASSFSKPASRGRCGPRTTARTSTRSIPRAGRAACLTGRIPTTPRLPRRACPSTRRRRATTTTRRPNDFMSDYLRMLGGTSLHWQGTSLRLVPNDFRMQSVYGHGLDWPIGYDDLEPAYRRAEEEIGVSADVEDQRHLRRVVPGRVRLSDAPHAAELRGPVLRRCAHGQVGATGRREVPAAGDQHPAGAQLVA